MLLINVFFSMGERSQLPRVTLKAWAARDRAHRLHRPRGSPYEGAGAEVRVARLQARGVPWQHARLTATETTEEQESPREGCGVTVRRGAYRAKAWAHGSVLTAHTGPGAHPTTVRGRRYAWHASTRAVCPDNMPD